MSSKNLLGVFDTSKTRLTLGKLIIFYELLQLEQKLQKATYIDIFFTNTKKTVPKNLLELSRSFSNIRHSFDRKKMMGKSKAEYDFIFPESLLPDASFDSTEKIGKYFKLHKWIPTVEFKYDARLSAQNFLKDHKIGHPITVHIKPDIFGMNTWKVWHALIKQVLKVYPKLGFIFLGNDEVPKLLQELPNVVQVKSFNLGLSVQLALITCSKAFVGTVSGPSNIAIFSKIPYLLYKHPLQHPGFFENDLLKKTHFPFAQKQQKILLEIPTSENLIANFFQLAERM